MIKKALFFLSLVTFLFVVPLAHAQDTFKVTKVVDGDTIQVDVRGKKEVVRLLGIDTPETVDPRKPVQCFGKAASDKMKSFVNGKSVILVDDSTQGNRDKYNRLLRYVYLPDSKKTFVNGEMVKQGYAYSYRQYSTKMLEKFNGFEKYAREHNLGLWGACPVKVTPTKASVSANTVQKATTTQSQAQTGSTAQPNLPPATTNGFTCQGKTTCGQMSSCAEAQFYLNSCGVSRLDGDKDGVPCETLCN